MSEFTNLQLLVLCSGSAIVGAILMWCYIAWKEHREIMRGFRSALTTRQIDELSACHHRR